MKSVIVLLALIFSITANAGSNEKEILSDWENVQRKYAQTELFEKIDDKKYKFKNTGFGYDGILTVKNVIVDTSEGMFKKTAEVVVELDIPKNEMYKNSLHTYSRWEETNYLVYDDKREKWVRFRDLSVGKIGCSKPNANNLPPLWRQLLLAILPIIMVIIVFLTMRTSITKESKRFNEQLLSNSIEIAKDIKRIADHLEKKG